MVKLSAKMVEVMEMLKKADWYYLDGTKEKGNQTIQDFHTREGKKTCFMPTHILKGGYVGITGHTTTLKALEKRGLINIIEIGGSSMDIVELIGAEWKEPLTKAVKINLYRKMYSDYTKSVIEQNLTEYVELGFIEQAEKEYKEKFPAWETVEFTAIEEVPVEIWEG